MFLSAVSGTSTPQFAIKPRPQVQFSGKKTVKGPALRRIVAKTDNPNDPKSIINIIFPGQETPDIRIYSVINKDTQAPALVIQTPAHWRILPQKETPRTLTVKGNQPRVHTFSLTQRNQYTLTYKGNDGRLAPIIITTTGVKLGKKRVQYHISCDDPEVRFVRANAKNQEPPATRSTQEAQ